MDKHKIDSLEYAERALKAQLGDKYDLAIKHCYSLLQVSCRMQEQKFPPNTFVCQDSGGVYRLTKYGFRKKIHDTLEELEQEDRATNGKPKTFIQRVFRL